MPGPFFAGAPNAFAGGMEFSAGQRRRRLGDNALSALIQQYGPEAADPASMATLEHLQQTRELHPYDVAAAQAAAATAARQQAAQAALVEQHGAIAGDPTAVATGNLMDTTDRETRHRAGLNAATYLQGVKAKGGNMSDAFDRVMKILPAVGVPAELLEPIRDQILTNPDSIDELVAMLRGEDSTKGLSGGQPMYNDKTHKLEWVIPTGSGFRTVPGYTPATAQQGEVRLEQGAQRLGLGYQQLSWEQAKAMLPSAQPGVQYYQTPEGRVVADVTPGSPQATKQDTDAQARVEALTSDIHSAKGSAIEPAKTVVGAVDKALEMMDSEWFKQGGIAGALARTGGKMIPGTPPWEISRLIDTIRGNIGFSQLSSMPRGLGAISERELQQLEGVLGQLQVNRDPKLLRADLIRIRGLQQEILRKSESEVQRWQGEMDAAQTRRGTSYGPAAPAPTRGGGRAGTAPAGDDLDSLLDHYAPK